MIHPVIKYIKARKNKKVPINDGRKIVMVNFGGFMTGAYSAGAMLALVEMGYQNSFDSIYTISSGFHNACSFLSGDGYRNTSVYYEDLCRDNFFKPERIWKMIDIEKLVDILKYKKPINVSNLLKQKTKLYVRLANTDKKKEEYVEVHQLGKSKFFDLVRAAASVPFLSPGKIKLGRNKYEDPIWFDNRMVEHLDYVTQTNATDIVVIYNQYSQFEYIKKHFKSLNHSRFLNIYPKKAWRLSRFENNPEVLKQASRRIGKKVKSLFGLKSGITLFESNK
jgi:predicted patatin/cPLA2 family phospholipase